jgi:ABC-type sugar transport system permease subunit
MKEPFVMLVLFSLTPQAMAMPLNHCGEYVVSTNGSTLRRTNANTTGLHTGSDNITMLTNTSTSTAPNSSQTVLLRDEIEPADYRSLALLFYIVFFVFAMIAIVMFLGLLIATFVKKKCNWRKVKEHRKEKHISKDLEKAEAIMVEKTGD